MVPEKDQVIEKAKKEDLDKVMGIWLNTNIVAHPFIPESCWKGLFEQVKEAMPASELFIYHDKTEVAGFIGIMDQGYIAGLFVDEKAQSRGIGQQLLNHCKKLYTNLELDVFAENTGAVRFYQNNGFEITNTRISPDFNRKEYHMIWRA